MKDIFTKYYLTNYWSGKQSRSGTGSDFDQTVNIRRELPKVFDKLKIESLVDIPCGDFNWFQDMPMKFKYIGLDIAEVIIDDNKIKYPEVYWDVADITKDNLPKVDLIFTRDCLGHLADESVIKAVENIKRAKPKYFIATDWGVNRPPQYIFDGGWQPINMEHYLDKDFVLLEKIQEDVEGKMLGVWKLV